MRSIWYGRLAAKLEEKRQQSVEYLVGGGARGGSNPTAENYMEQVGYVRGLKEALDLADEVDSEMLGRPRNGTQGSE